MTVPREVLAAVRKSLWETADELGWADLRQADKARRYDIWTRDPSIGGQLGQFMDPRAVRVYLKDTIMKGYGRHSLENAGPILDALEIERGIHVAEKFIKPHGRLLADGRVICWSKASDWKITLIAVRERAMNARGAKPYAAVLIGHAPRYSDVPAGQQLIRDIADDLGIERFVWVDGKR